MQLICGDTTLDLATPCVMGVLNVTPDSFSDGGRFLDAGAAVAQARRMAEEGAAIIDIGGESTRPGAQAVGEEEERRRVLPVVEAIAGKLPVVVSVDTSKPGVMRAAIDAGAGMINDVRALQSPGALEVIASSRVAVCLMHMQGEPRTMQAQPRYADVVREVGEFLGARVAACREHGIARERLVIDPGFGFGKTLEHNLALLASLDQFTNRQLPVLVGLSRKSMIGTILGRPVEDRLHGSLALAVVAVMRGARIVRAHDVAATVDAVRIASAAARGGSG